MSFSSTRDIHGASLFKLLLLRGLKRRKKKMGKGKKATAIFPRLAVLVQKIKRMVV